jgi:putative phage-type endonuclease
LKTQGSSISATDANKGKNGNPRNVDSANTLTMSPPFLFYLIVLFAINSCSYGLTVQNKNVAKSSKSEDLSVEAMYDMAGRTRQRKRNRGRQARVPLLEPSIARGRKNGKNSKAGAQPSILPQEIASVSISPRTEDIITANITLVNGTQIIVDPRNFHQREDQSLWLAVRSSLDITASEFSGILNNSFFTSREKLLGIKCGTIKRFSGNSPACKWGLKMEPYAFNQYAQVTGNIVNETGLHIWEDSETSRNYGASPDGLVIDVKDQSEGLLEIKCLWGRRTQKEIGQFDHCPNRFYDQIQGQLAICDREWCDLMIYIPPTGRFKNYCILRIPRDREYWSNTILPALTDFCDDVDKLRAGDEINESS